MLEEREVVPSWCKVLIAGLIVLCMALSALCGWLYAQQGAMKEPEPEKQKTKEEVSSDTQTEQDLLQPISPQTGVPKPSNQVSFYNGDVVIRPMSKRLCPLSVSVQGHDRYYIYLDSLNDSSNDMAFTVGSGCIAEVDVPIGSYEIYYATGSTWYGVDLLFGEETNHYKCQGIFDFYNDGEYYNGHSLELYKQSGGNMSTFEVDESEFPG